jgi:hypothetical protein
MVFNVYESVSRVSSRVENIYNGSVRGKWIGTWSIIV